MDDHLDQYRGPVGAYQNFDRFASRLSKQYSHKDPSLLALQRLAVTKPAFAKDIFKKAAIGHIEYSLKHIGPPAKEISDEGKRRIEDLESRFLQEPMIVLAHLEAIIVIEVAESWAEDTARLTLGKSLAEVRATNLEWGASCTQNGYFLATLALGEYVSRRNYYIALGLASAIDGVPFETHLEEILDDIRKRYPEGKIDRFLDGTTNSILGVTAAHRIIDWAMGDTEF